MAFPFTVGGPASGLIPVGRLANGEVPTIEDTPDGRKRVSVRFHNGTETSYLVSRSGQCDYLTPGHNSRT